MDNWRHVGRKKERQHINTTKQVTTYVNKYKAIIAPSRKIMWNSTPERISRILFFY